MTSLPLVVYIASVLGLWLKVLGTTLIQARERYRARVFAYPEDAAEWHGTAGEDTALCQRAQRLLRNDSETQPFFYVFGALLVLSKASPTAALIYLPAYVVSRFVHGYFLLSPRQPHRNRAFGVGVIILTAMAIQSLVALISGDG
jgi:uncharacterized membrane protein YecN with MAPEG domain